MRYTEDDPLILTADTLPPDLELVEVYGIVEATQKVQVSEKDYLQVFEDKADPRRDRESAEDLLFRASRRGTNVIYGVRISTATAKLKDRDYLFITYCGTAARCRERT